MTGGIFTERFQRVSRHLRNSKSLVRISGVPDLERDQMAYRREEVLTQERMRDLLDFDPATGIFTWKIGRKGGRGITPGMRAGSVKPTGNKKRYRYIKIDDVDYLAKRLAWFWAYGKWPSFLRCIDGDEDNCAIGNLKDAGFVDGGPGSSRTNRDLQRLRYKAENPSKVRDAALRATFGIGIDRYEEMHVAQDGKCAICGNGETITRHGKVRLLAVDHCHTTGKVRQLLCGNCNPMLGYARDDAEVLRKASEYIVQHQSPAIFAMNANGALAFGA